MKNNKRYIVLLIILVVFFVLMYTLIGKDSIENRKKEATILVGDGTTWEYSNNRWVNLKLESSIEKYNWKKFKVFLDNEYKDDYLVWHDDKWYLFDDNKVAQNYTENFLGINSNYDIKTKSFEVKDIENYNYVEDVFNKNDITSSTELTVNTHTEVDLDNDGQVEDIYIVSNVFPIDFEPSQVFSFVFVVKNNKIYNLYKSIEKYEGTNGTKPYINSIIDVDDDGDYEILLTCAKYSTEQPINILYKFIDNDFKILISNQ